MCDDDRNGVGSRSPHAKSVTLLMCVLMCLSLHRADARCTELMHEVFEEAVARGDGDHYTPVIRRGLVKDKAEITGSDR